MATLGPFVTTIGGTGLPNDYYFHQQKWKSKPRVPLPYFSDRKWALTRNGVSPAARDLIYARDDNARSKDLAANLAYDRFLGGTREMASLGATLAEFGQTTQMIVGNIRKLSRFTQAIKRFDIPSALKALERTDAPKRGTSKVKSSASLWLEFHFGWEPLIKEIFTLLKVLEEPIKATHVVGSATDVYSDKEIRGPYSPNYTWVVRTKVKMGAELYVDNVNLALSSQLGLINPAAVAWELVPLSFVADWLTSMGQVIASHSDFVGLRLEKGFSVTLEECIQQEVWNNYGWEASTKGVRMTRGTGIILPVLALKRFRGFSAIRGATAASLLVQQLRSLR